MTEETRVTIPTALGIGGPVIQIAKRGGGRVYELGHLPDLPDTDGEKPRVPSVTSIVGSTLRMYQLERWRNDWIERGLKEQHGKYLSKSGIHSVLNASQNEADESARIGIEMHNIIDSILSGSEATVPDQLEPALQGFLKWRRKFIHWELLGTEVAVWHDLSLYAGTVDALWYDPETNEYIVCDWKTSSGIYDTAAMQVCAYAVALRNMICSPFNTESRKPVSVRGMIVRFDNAYPTSTVLDTNGKKKKVKDRTQPKIFTDKVQYTWIDIADWFPAFACCLNLVKDRQKLKLELVKL